MGHFKFADTPKVSLQTPYLRLLAVCPHRQGELGESRCV